VYSYEDKKEERRGGEEYVEGGEEGEEEGEEEREEEEQEEEGGREGMRICYCMLLCSYCVSVVSVLEEEGRGTDFILRY